MRPTRQIPEQTAARRRAFGRRVRALPRDRSRSQEDLAERSALHRTYIGGIERGERNPTLETMAKLAEGLGVEPATLEVGSLLASGPCGMALTVSAVCCT